jgi:WD40 repeat protein
VGALCCRRGPVTSVEWSPHESAMLVTTGADNALAVWDLALERDPEEELQVCSCLLLAPVASCAVWAVVNPSD